MARLSGTVLALFAIASISSSHAAGAVCLPTPHYRYVGNDVNCTDGDVQSAINNVVCPGTIILITDELTYTSQSLSIDNKVLALTGVSGACGNPITICDPSIGCGGGGSGTPPPPAVTLNGSGANRVISITGNSEVTLQGLEITGGSAPAGLDGGGISFSGSGSLTTIDSTIDFNTASVGHGGGIDFAGGTLTLGYGTIVDQNSAYYSGGGIRVSGGVLDAVAPFTDIAYNSTLDNGGGVDVDGATAYIGSVIIQNNTAGNGGGIAIEALQGDSTVFLFTTHQPELGITQNQATSRGGGIFVNAPSNTRALLCASDFPQIEVNSAADGAALYLSGPYSEALLNSNDGGFCNGIADAPAPGPIACVPGMDCNDILGNGAISGGTLTAEPLSTLIASRVQFRFNHSASLVAMADPIPVKLRGVLMVDNITSDALIRIEGLGHPSTSASIEDSTIANNKVGGSEVLFSGVELNLSNDIIDQPSVASVLMETGASVTAGYLLAADMTGLPTQPDVVQGQPTYMDTVNHDYHLQPTSLGVDFAPATGGIDLDGLPRDADLIQVPNVFGPRDLGAYERQSFFKGCGAGDSLFCNGFEP